MSTDVKLRTAQLSKIIKSGGYFGNMMGNLCTKTLKYLTVSLAKDVLSKLATKATSPI